MNHCLFKRGFWGRGSGGPAWAKAFFFSLKEKANPQIQSREKREKKERRFGVVLVMLLSGGWRGKGGERGFSP